jgi:hypothetical protein
MGKGTDRKGSGKWAGTENQLRKQIPLAIERARDLELDTETEPKKSQTPSHE